MKEINIVLISNIVFNTYWRENIEKSFLLEKIKVSTFYINYDEIFSQSNKIIENADYVVVCLNFDVLYPNFYNEVLIHKLDEEYFITDAIERSTFLYKLIKQITNVPLFWIGFEDYCYNIDYVVGNEMFFNGIVDRINILIKKNILNSDIFLDLKRLISKNGYMCSYAVRYKRLWNAPYSKKLIKELCNEIYRQHKKIEGKIKKCLVIDADNVLWGGIVSEVGIDGIQISNVGKGRIYQDFQKFLLTLYNRGIILAVCSKNDYKDVIEVFNKHTGMILKEEHIAIFKVNWNSKPENIEQIANELNIGMDSIVFVDDSDFEIEFVGSLLPELFTIKFSPDLGYDEFSVFSLSNNMGTHNNIQRNMTYKTNAMRYELKINSNSYDEYLKSLEMKIDIHIALSNEMYRISELTQRTNKCTNGKRYTLSELESILKNNEYELYTVSLSDKFSNLGLVGVIGIFDSKIDLFSLSCRALGRNIEQEMLKIAIDKKIKKYDFYSTKKNHDLKILMDTILNND